jgi:hypothetical protein
MDCVNGVCKNQMPYFKNFEDDISFEECIIYLILTPILYFAILIMIEEKIFAKLFMKITCTKLKSDNCDAMDDEVKKEKLAVMQEINELNSQSKIIFNIFHEKYNTHILSYKIKSN